jgi:hypothetical protein
MFVQFLESDKVSVHWGSPVVRFPHYFVLYGKAFSTVVTCGGMNVQHSVVCIIVTYSEVCLQ